MYKCECGSTDFRRLILGYEIVHVEVDGLTPRDDKGITVEWGASNLYCDKCGRLYTLVDDTPDEENVTLRLVLTHEGVT